MLDQMSPESGPDQEQYPKIGTVAQSVLWFSPEKFCPHLSCLWPEPTQVSKDDRSDVESSSEEEDVTTSAKSSCGSSSRNGANRVNGHMGGSYWAEE